MDNHAFIQFRTGGKKFIKFRKEVGQLIRIKVDGRFRSVCRFYIHNLTREAAYELIEEITNIAKRYGTSAYIRSLQISSFEFNHQVGKL